MRKSVLLSPLLAALAFASPAQAVDWYVSPIGTNTSGCVTRDATCSLAAAAAAATAGDTVILMDGIYKEMLYIAGSGTPEAWLTFKADDCATPIIEGPGVPPTSDNQDNGVHSETGTYLRFIGIVSRGWNIGFGNKWIGSDSSASNGHWEYEYVLANSNGRNGISFFSAEGIKIKNSIAAHNGSSTLKSWSSGITLLQAKGGSANVIDGNVAFENMDAQKGSDGSGFIVDEHSDGITFTNNIAFRNGGSCLRLTRSKETRFINNTCFHNAQKPEPELPADPSEVYFTNNGDTPTGISFWNNVFVATGVDGGQKVIAPMKPSAGFMNNIEVIGAAPFLTAPDGDNPDFTLAATATNAIGMGTTGDGVPGADIGFDPKCIVKREPTLIGEIAKGPWWIYDVDIDYIKSIGGVKGCFNPAARSGTPDIGAYKNGAVTRATPGVCIPAVPGTGVIGTGGAGGTTATGGTDAGGASAGGTTATGGVSTAGDSATGGSVSAGGSTSTAGGTTSAGGASGTPGVSSGGTTAGTTASAGGTTSGTGTNDEDSAAEDAGGCGCRLAPESSSARSLAALSLFGWAIVAFRRRRRPG